MAGEGHKREPMIRGSLLLIITALLYERTIQRKNKILQEKIMEMAN